MKRDSRVRRSRYPFERLPRLVQVLIALAGVALILFAGGFMVTSNNPNGRSLSGELLHRLMAWMGA